MYVNEGTLTIGACPILRYQQYSRDSHGPVGGAGLQYRLIRGLRENIWNAIVI